MYSQKSKFRKSSHCFCDKFHKDFDYNYQNQEKSWYFCYKNKIEIITLLEYELCHLVLGCEIFLRLHKQCPRCLFVPMATLVHCCISTNKNILRCEPFICLYRGEDDAIALLFPKFIAYLIPYTQALVDNFDGFKFIKKSN